MKFYRIQRRLKYLAGRPAYNKKHWQEVKNNPEKLEKFREQRRLWGQKPENKIRKKQYDEKYLTPEKRKELYKKRSIDRKLNPERYRNYKLTFYKKHPNYTDRYKSIGKKIPMKETGAVVRSSIALDDLLHPTQTQITKPRYTEYPSIIARRLRDLKK